jgi:hypothetical protein
VFARLRGGLAAGARRIAYISRNAFAVYRAHTGTLILAGVIIFVPAAAIEAGIDAAVDANSGTLPFNDLLVLLTAIGTSTLAYQMYKGVATRASLLWRAGDPDVSIGDVLRRLPYLQLVIVDVALTFGTTVGIALLVIPGIIFGTFFSLAPVVVEIDECSAWQGLKRSAKLVRGSFILVLILQTAVVVVTAAFEGMFDVIGKAIIPGGSPVGDAIALGAITAFLASMLVKPIGALAVIELTHELRNTTGAEQPPALSAEGST